jgi:hypothetical protein
LLRRPVENDNAAMDAEPSRKRRLQFSLRTLLIVFTLFAVPLGYIGSQARIVSQRKALFYDIAKHGGTAATDEGFSDRTHFHSLYVDVDGTKWNDADFKRLLDLPNRMILKYKCTSRQAVESYHKCLPATGFARQLGDERLARPVPVSTTLAAGLLPCATTTQRPGRLATGANSK